MSRRCGKATGKNCSTNPEHSYLTGVHIQALINGSAQSIKSIYDIMRYINVHFKADKQPA